MADYAQRYFFGIVADGCYRLCANLILSGELLHQTHGVLKKLKVVEALKRIKLKFRLRLKERAVAAPYPACV
jgi:hypothetical protein